MSPAEIISRIPPQARTDALIAFIAIDALKFASKDPGEIRLLKEAHYTELRDSLVARANESLEHEQRLADEARAAVDRAMAQSKDVIVRRRVEGKQEVTTIRGFNAAAVEARAKEMVGNIDRYRSPAVTTKADDQHGRHVVEVRAHSLD
ncbi:hypothetical protein BKK79_00790 [Cupriavidus sp. USMAA2-4]|uniref:hypothetical protein n=1 Tax=Cupriavidus sp. USMAA2-4 TaxID=876364 RepID=UPI0008A6B366|nr:hypothetical protein [Cupriavidus sp. USMAA2-4]AOY90525.1 hypothetical protein BKK79_00790 [Cupriavidus sp. USMAA2-4]